METVIAVPAEIDHSLREVVQNQLAFKLGSLKSTIRKLNITMKVVDEEIECRILATLKGGVVVCFTTSNENPSVCIKDAVARLHRHVMRSVRFKQVS